ncbi:MAG: hypothetical protein U0572_00290 [Phycisphaerales bacterium]
MPTNSLHAPYTRMMIASLLVLGAATIPLGCSAAPGPSTARAASASAAQPTVDRFAGVNTVAKDRGVWQQLLDDHTKIHRTLVHRQDGDLGVVEATTESDDPIVAARIIDHAKAMQARMKVGAQVRVWDPVFAELFSRYGDITLELALTDKGVTIIESSRNPEAVALLRSHAMGVNEFVREGDDASGRETPRLPAGAPLPPAEVALGGVRHRFLLVQPDAGQVDELRDGGVEVVVNFRTPEEQANFDERAIVRGAGIEYYNLPYTNARDLTDELLDRSRATMREVDATGRTAAMHCRKGNRVGPAWAAYRAVDVGVPVEQAIAEAKAVGMMDPALESATRDYIRRTLAAKSVGAAE